MVGPRDLRIGYTDIFRLTSRGPYRPFRGGSRTSRISSTMAESHIGITSGGKDWRSCQFTSNYPDGMSERQSVRIDVLAHCRLVHHETNGAVCQHHAIEFLLDEFRRLASQYDPPSAHVGFEFIQRDLDLPTLRIESRQFLSRGLLWIQEGGYQAVKGFSPVGLQVLRDAWALQWRRR